MPLPNLMQRPMLLPNLMPLPNQMLPLLQQMLLLLKQHSFNLLKNASQLSMFLKNNWTSNSISSLEHSMTEDIRTPESSMMLRSFNSDRLKMKKSGDYSKKAES